MTIDAILIGFIIIGIISLGLAIGELLSLIPLISKAIDKAMSKIGL